MNRKPHFAVVFPVLVCLSIIITGTPLSAFDKAQSDYFTALKARSIGPAGMSGRIAAVDVALSNPRIIYVGAATGGLWKSVNGGITWKPIFDGQSTSSIGDVTIAPDNPETIWVGTGEANPRNSAGVGRGIFKSLDGGETWAFLGLEKTEKISRLLVDPTRPDTAFAAAMGTTWGENPERGVFKTTDGGKTWKKVLYVDEKTGAADLAMDPVNPNRLLAAMWEHRRWPWYFNSGGPGSGLYLSTDGGETWKKLGAQEGLPVGHLGRIGIAFSRSSPSVVYALVEAEKSALCRSENSGNTWQIVNDKPGVNPRPFYYCDIRVHPIQENTVYRLSSPLDVSRDGGKTFKRLMSFFAVHGDFHELWIHPEDGQFMIVGGDGGIGLSYDGGAHWNFVQNLPLAQFYHISVDMDQPYNVYGGMQDNGSWRGPSQVSAGMGIFNFHWLSVGFGDGFATLATPQNSKIGYSMSQGGFLMRFNTETGEQKDIRPPAPEGVELRFNWNSAIALDPLDTKVMYYGSQFLHKTRDEGQTWDIISPDLTSNDPEKQKQAESGGLTKDVTNAENHCTIMTISPSPLQKGVIWVGTDDGRVQLTLDGGQTWTDLTAKLTGSGNTVPEGTWVPHIEASHHDAGTAYVVFEDHRRSNWTPYAFVTEDFGAAWKALNTTDIDGFIQVIREDPVQRNLLFLGTEFGLYVSFNRGQSWMKWNHGLPTVPVRDMVIHPRDHDLVIGTHGRAAYILDDIQPLREWTKDIEAKNVHLFPIIDAYQFRTNFLGYGYLTPGDMEFRGENRPYGALITYSLGKERESQESKSEEPADASDQKRANRKSEEKISIDILDADGKVVQTLKGPKKPGLNRINWDLRHTAFKSISSPYAGFFAPSGPYVLPGTYTARIELAGDIFEQSFHVHADPRSHIPEQARKARYDLIRTNGKYIEAVTEAYKHIEKLSQAVTEVMLRLGQLPKDKQGAVKAKGEAVKGKLEAFSRQITPPKDRSGVFRETELEPQLTGLGFRLETSLDAPTAGQKAEFKRLEAETKAIISKINQFFAKEYKEFAVLVEESGLSRFPEVEAVTIEDQP